MYNHKLKPRLNSHTYSLISSSSTLLILYVMIGKLGFLGLILFATQYRICRVEKGLIQCILVNFGVDFLQEQEGSEFQKRGRVHVFFCVVFKKWNGWEEREVSRQRRGEGKRKEVPCSLWNVLENGRRCGGIM